MGGATRGLVGVLASALVLAGCDAVSVSRATPSSQAVSPTPTPTTTAKGGPRPTSPATLPRRVRADLERVREAYPDDEISVALLPVGASGRPAVVGEPTTAVAWSTIKVPLGLAARRADPKDEQVAAQTLQAITASDNTAALGLWAGLGTPAQAGEAVEDVLRDGGDRRTQVQSRTTVSGYSPFGQTRWRVVDQVRFTAGLTCLEDADLVTADMDQVVAGQRWGLGQVPKALFKGGWGPTSEGYVLRQLAVVPARQAHRGTAVVLQVRSQSDHAHTTAVADEIGRVVHRRQADLPSGRCP